MKKEVKLPHKPSDLIRLALDDLARAEASRLYVVNMAVWHTPGTIWGKEGKNLVRTRKCAVCFAGAVIAGTLHGDHEKRVVPQSFGSENEGKLDALDDFREGNVQYGFAAMDLGGGGFDPNDGSDFDRVIIDYKKDPDKFKLELRELASDLEAAGY